MKSKEVLIPITNTIRIKGDLSIPKNNIGTILFAHGSGSGRKSVRNRFTAEIFREVGFTTLLVDLLTEEESQIDEANGQYRFDIPMLSQRLITSIEWLKSQNEVAFKSIGLYGASTGGAAALIAGVKKKNDIFAIVSRGGRVDLAADYAQQVSSPTLFIVGERDQAVIDLNRSVFEKIPSKKDFKIVKNAGHLFEEPGTLEEASKLSRNWFFDCISLTNNMNQRGQDGYE